MNIYLIRHGRQSSGLCNVDVNLSPEGRRQAGIVARRMKPWNIQGLWCSDLIRARETAEIIGAELNLKPEVAEGIREIDFGDWTGKSDSELEQEYGRLRYDFYHGIQDIRYPGGENGQDCSARFEKAMNEIIHEARNRGFERIALVTHGVAMRTYLCRIFSIPFRERGLLAKSFENCSITELRLTDDDTFFLERFNDYAHLEPYDELLRKHFK